MRKQTVCFRRCLPVVSKNSNAFREKGAKFIHNAPYILAHLAGLSADEMFVDWGAMSGWGLGYNVYTKEWSKAQLDILDLDIKYMPKIVRPWDIIGRLTEEAAEETGLPQEFQSAPGPGYDAVDERQRNFRGRHAVDDAGTCSMFCVSTNGLVPELSRKGSGLILTAVLCRELISIGDLSVPAVWPCDGIKIISAERKKTADIIRN